MTDFCSGNSSTHVEGQYWYYVW